MTIIGGGPPGRRSFMEGKAMADPIYEGTVTDALAVSVLVLEFIPEDKRPGDKLDAMQALLLHLAGERYGDALAGVEPLVFQAFAGAMTGALRTIAGRG